MLIMPIIICCAAVSEHCDEDFFADKFNWGSAPGANIQVLQKNKQLDTEILLCTDKKADKKIFDLNFDSIYYRYVNNRLRAVSYSKKNISQDVYNNLKSKFTERFGTPLSRESQFTDTYESRWTAAGNSIALEYFPEDYDENEFSEISLSVTEAVAK